MIADNRLALHMSFIGMTDAATGLPFQGVFGQDDNLSGATFRLSKILLAKSFIQHILGKESEAATEADVDYHGKELNNLSKACRSSDGNKNNGTLREASEERVALLRENSLLKSYRKIIQTIHLRHPSGTVVCDLGRGKLGTYPDGEHRWLVKVPSEEECNVSLLQVGNMQVSLSGILLPASHGHAFRTQLTPDRIICVPHQESNKITLFFTLHESWNAIDIRTVLDGHHFVRWLRVQIAGGSSENSTYDIPNYDGPELFLRLVFLEFRMCVVGEYLQALGVDTSPVEENGDE